MGIPGCFIFPWALPAKILNKQSERVCLWTGFGAYVHTVTPLGSQNTFGVKMPSTQNLFPQSLILSFQYMQNFIIHFVTVILKFQLQ